jgi:hypothetical protein
MPFKLYQYIKSLTGLTGSPSIEVCSSFDLHNTSTLLDSSYNLFLSAGHDEYWSKEMCDQVASFVANGGNAAFFSANTAWWQVLFEDSGHEAHSTVTNLVSWSAGSFSGGLTPVESANGLVLLYAASDGSAVTAGFTRAGVQILRTFPAAAFASGWNLLVDAGILQ